MLALFMYPVSGILKLWHSLVHSVVPENAAWLISLVLLVLTVRGLIAPLNWMSVLAGRRAALMRPEKLELDERKKQASSVAEMKELLKEEQALTKKYNYNPLVGCLPSLIMIPAFLGLYRVILGMAQPQAKDHIGLLNHHDVEAFRATELSNIPLPAYVSMPADTANYLVHPQVGDNTEGAQSDDRDHKPGSEYTFSADTLGSSPPISTQAR